MTTNKEFKSHFLDKELLSEKQFQQAEDYALTQKISIEDSLLFLNLTDYTKLGQCLARIHGRPYHPLISEPPPDPAKALISLKLVERFHIFPVAYDKDNKILILAAGDVDTDIIVDQLRDVLSDGTLNIRFTIASNPEIKKAIDVHYKGGAYKPAEGLEIPQEFTILGKGQKPREDLEFEDEIRSEKRVLLLEPDLDRSRALKTLLRKEGFQDVNWASSPEEVIRIIKESPSDLLLVNGRYFHKQGSWLTEISREIELPTISFYLTRPLLLGQEYPYNQMSEALISLMAFLVRNSLRKDSEKLQQILMRVRYCKLLALRLGLSPGQVDGAVLAAWLSTKGLGEQLLQQIPTPYDLEEIVAPEDEVADIERVEALVLRLVKHYQILKKSQPDVATDIDQARRILSKDFSSTENKSILETFLNVIKDEEFLRKVDQTSGTIIIVDPTESRDPTLALRLTNEGYHVEEISDAGTAAKVILKTGANVVISEINLPDTDGLRFCRALRKNPNTAHITFFFHTTEEGERLAAECLEAGADDFLKKPADPELLSLKIQRTLAMKSPQESKKGVSGSLTEMSSSDIIQSLAAGDKDVEINLEDLGKKGRIYIEGGEIIHADVEGIEGEEAFYRLMAWEKGDFQIVPCSQFPQRTIYGGTMSLLMEGARLADEAAGE